MAERKPNPKPQRRTTKGVAPPVTKGVQRGPSTRTGAPGTIIPTKSRPVGRGTPAQMAAGREASRMMVNTPRIKAKGTEALQLRRSGPPATTEMVQARAKARASQLGKKTK